MLKHGVQGNTTTTGTGTVTLSAVAGMSPASARFIVGAFMDYAIFDANGNKEWGIGTVGASNTLARTTITGTLVGTTYTVGGTALSLSGSASVACVEHEGSGGRLTDVSSPFVALGTTTDGSGTPTGVLVDTSGGVMGIVLAKVFSTAPAGYISYGGNYNEVLGNYATLIGYPGNDDDTVHNVALNALTWFGGPTGKIPGTAQVVRLGIDIKIVAKGVASTHESNLAIFADHAGTLQRRNFAQAVYEPVGMVAGTWIGGCQIQMDFPITGLNGEITYRLFDSAGAAIGTNIQGMQFTGYIDG